MFTFRVKYSISYSIKSISTEGRKKGSERAICSLRWYSWVSAHGNEKYSDITWQESSGLLFFCSAMSAFSWMPFDEDYSPMTGKGTFMALFALSIRVGGSFSRLCFFAFSALALYGQSLPSVFSFVSPSSHFFNHFIFYFYHNILLFCLTSTIFDNDAINNFLIGNNHKGLLKNWTRFLWVILIFL